MASRLSSAEARAIVRVLAEWGAIATRSEAEALLQTMVAPSFSAAEWAAPPLDLLSAGQPSASLVTPPHNLPRLLTSFVGRLRELDEAAHLLETHPLVTITGTGGIGKTRFSLELAGRLLLRFPAGIYFVELATISNPELVHQAVAATLSLREQSEGSITVLGCTACCGG